MEEYEKEIEIYEYIKGKCLTFTSKHHRSLSSPFAIISYTSVFKGKDTSSASFFTHITKAQNFDS